MALSQTIINLCPGGRAILITLFFLRIAEKSGKQRHRFSYTFSCICILPTPFQKISAQGPFSKVTRPGQVTPPPRIFVIAPWLRFLGINMKLSLVDECISTYQTYTSEFWFRWPEIRSVFFCAHHYKAMGKCSDALYSEWECANYLKIFLF